MLTPLQQKMENIFTIKKTKILSSIRIAMQQEVFRILNRLFDTLEWLCHRNCV